MVSIILSTLATGREKRGRGMARTGLEMPGKLTEFDTFSVGVLQYNESFGFPVYLDVNKLIEDV